MSIEQFCERARLRYEKCIDFETRRQFLLDYIGEIKYRKDKVELRGSVPIELKAQEAKRSDAGFAQIEFCIQAEISVADRLGLRSE